MTYRCRYRYRSIDAEIGTDTVIKCPSADRTNIVSIIRYVACMREYQCLLQRSKFPEVFGLFGVVTSQRVHQQHTPKLPLRFKISTPHVRAWTLCHRYVVDISSVGAWTTPGPLQLEVQYFRASSSDSSIIQKSLLEHALQGYDWTSIKCFDHGSYATGVTPSRNAYWRQPESPRHSSLLAAAFEAPSKMRSASLFQASTRFSLPRGW